MVRWSLPTAVLTLVLGASAHAATVSIALTDSHGAPAVNAVVTLSAPNASAADMHVPDEATIDQRGQMFMPLVAVIRQGGRVVFANNDNTMHQVYSFSSIKQFEAEIERGQRSKPVVFDKAGIAIIGCNIHDNMIAYVYVSAAPYAAVTGEKGEARMTGVAPGRYRAEIWQPHLAGGNVTLDVTVTETGATIARTLTLAADKSASMRHKHQQSY